jgi:hypothetical protein
MKVGTDKIYPSNIFIIMALGSYLYQIGLIKEISEQAGRNYLVMGLILMMLAAIIGFVLIRKKYVAITTSCSCIYAVGINLWLMRFLDNMEAAARRLDNLATGGALEGTGTTVSLSVEQIQILRHAHIWITYAFLILALVAAFIAVLQNKRRAMEGIRGADDSTLIEDVVGKGQTVKIEYGKYKYCPKCLYQSEVDSEEDECPDCKVPMKMPDPFKPEDA